MNRRKFLDTAVRTAVMASWPAWLSSSFAADSPKIDVASELTVLSQGYRRAQRAGKPLLVLVIPADDGMKYYRGRDFGELLNHGSPEQMAPLALCEVICANMAQLKRLVPSAGDSEPLMVLIETDAVPARVQVLDAKLLPDRGMGSFKDSELDAELPPKSKEKEGERWQRRYQAKERIESRAVDSRIARLAQLVSDAVMPNREVLAQRASQQRAHLAAGVPASVDLKLGQNHDGTLTADEIDQAAALIASFAMGTNPERTKSLLAMLGQSATRELKQARVPGSKWAVSGGCGTTIEGEPRNMMVACGMGHVPVKSRRFLHFFTKGESL